MTNYFLKRLLQSVLVMLIVAFVSFSLFNFVGDPVHNMVGQEASAEKREEIREKLGLNDPIYTQFFRFVSNASKGEFGLSYQLRRPVSDLITERLPATLELVFVSALIAIFVGVFFGVYTGINREGFTSNFILIISLFGVSLPTFVIGILFIYLFSVILGILPSFGRGEVMHIGFWSTGFLTFSGLKALILPSVTLSLFQMTYIIRLVRAEMMEILQTDYIKFARARGINQNIINYSHALKNGLIPVITITGINVGTLIAFSIITETVFQWPGMGLLFINAVQFVDIPIMSAYLIMVAFIFVMINFIVDIAYYFIDPRIRFKEEAMVE
jgi:peptide/nickel transport system permease protein|tara:strand:- start:2332 stop:3315 length:984 start_codon:yes stop_codon:yes gene_type:complete